MLKLPKIYLASKSPRRSEMLASLKIPFEVISSPYEEKMEDVAGLSPEKMASQLAGFKASYVAESLRSGIIIGADTIVVKEDLILGKPVDKLEVFSMLHSLSGERHRVITGISLVDVERKITLTHSEVTNVFFRDLNPEDIEQYIQTGEPFDKAGAYGIQGYASLFVNKIEGCYFNVVGFPIVAFRNLMLDLGYNIVDYIRLEKS